MKSFFWIILREKSTAKINKKVYNGYQQLAKELNNIVTIDGNNTLDYVHNKIVNEIESFLK